MRNTYSSLSCGFSSRDLVAKYNSRSSLLVLASRCLQTKQNIIDMIKSTKYSSSYLWRLTVFVVSVFCLTWGHFAFARSDSFGLPYLIDQCETWISCSAVCQSNPKKKISGSIRWCLSIRWKCDAFKHIGSHRSLTNRKHKQTVLTFTAKLTFFFGST